MRAKRFTEERIIAAVRWKPAGRRSRLVANWGVSKYAVYAWKAKYGGMSVTDAHRLRQLEDENRRLNQMVADLSLDKEALNR